MLAARNWAALFDDDTVAYLLSVTRIVCKMLFGNRHELLVLRVLEVALYRNGTGILHLVRNNYTLESASCDFVLC